MAYYICKMVEGERSKTHMIADLALMLTGLFTLLFLGIGAAGLKSTSDDAEGAVGNAYAYFRTAETKLADAKANEELVKTLEAGASIEDYTNATGEKLISLATAKTTLAGVAAVQGWTAETSRAVVSGTVAAMGTQYSALADLVTSNELIPATVTTYGGIVRVIDAALAKCVAGISGLNELSAQLENYSGATELKKLDKAERAANVASLAILFTYISTMLALGLFPLVKGAKKFLRHAEPHSATAA
jgi:hypothetical protein